MSDKENKARRRQEALQRVPSLARHMHRVRVNDDLGVHITIWPHPSVEPVHWWPGTGRWSDPGGHRGANRGPYRDFKSFLLNLAKKPPPPDRSSVIDDEDDFT